MQFNVPLSAAAIDPAAIEARLQTLDPAALVDTDDRNHALRISTSLSEREIASLLADAGHPVDPARIAREPSICCGGCGG